MIDVGLVLQGRYEILKRLGAGGMGEVYQSLDRQSGQRVAVKRLLLEQEDTDKALLERRFEEEKAILRRLSFSGIPAFVDGFIEDGHSYLVMEFIDGFSLDTMLDFSREHYGRGLSAEQVATVALQVSQVLEHLHSQVPPLVHRDIKPSNLIIRESDERVFLVDFGLAREVRSQSSAKTQVGTWCYAPIEQIRGRSEPRSDFYALGVTMLELLTGQVPAALSVPKALSFAPQLHPELADIIDRCTRAEVTQRYPEAILLRQDLEQVLPKLTQAPAPPLQHPEDRVSELVMRWGRGRAAPEPQVTPPTPSPGPQDLVPLGARPEVKKQVERARRRLQQRSGVWRIVLLLCLLAAMVAAWIARDRFEQRRLADQGGPGTGWTCFEARGLGQGPGLEIGYHHPLSGSIYRRSVGSEARELRFHYEVLQGRPETLVFCGSYGFHLSSTGGRNQAEVVWLATPQRLSWPLYRSLGKQHPLGQAGDLALTVNRGRLTFWQDGKERERFSPGEGSWVKSSCCGVLLQSPRDTLARARLTQWLVR